MKVDFHLHSSFSGDSDTPAEEVILAGIKQGLSVLCFTEHLDKDFVCDGLSFELDTEGYFKKLRSLQDAFKGKLDIRIGVELGLQSYLSEFHRNYIKQYPFDFVIGSTHLVDGCDPYYPEFWKNRNADEGLRRYFALTLENIKTFDDFDVYGHLDYMIRYVPTEPKIFHYNTYQEQVDENLKTIISNGKGIEVNTGGYKAGLGVPNPCPDVIRRYRELGGEIVTIGADAHFPEYVGFHFEDAREILKDCGFRYFTVFK